MQRLIAFFIAAVASALCISIAYASSTTPKMQPLIVKAGDLIIQKDKSVWSAIKILAVDPWPDGSAAAHCLTYETTSGKPTFESLKEAKIRIWHAPINASSFKDWELVGNQAPSRDEFSGFIEYLKLTDSVCQFHWPRLKRNSAQGQ